ncbi:MAG: crossover junction endodeoxyribonuclease RuvC [Spirochaetaceae bacterium]|nr:crossover junction endodeoxyribonuclease RuvC [Spirochaetaceae bacterium]
MSCPPSAASTRILGIDPGLASSGWGIVEYRNNRLYHIAHGCIETGPDLVRGERLLLIGRALREVIAAYKPVLASMETLYFARNVSSALPVAEARGVLSMVLAEQGIALREFTPNAIKQAVVGESRASKSQVQDMLRLILGLKEIPRPDHAADALGAAVCAAHAEGPVKTA